MVEPGVGVVAEGVGGGVRVLLARRLWAISLGSHRRAVFQIGGGVPPVQTSPVRPFPPYWAVQPSERPLFSSAHTCKRIIISRSFFCNQTLTGGHREDHKCYQKLLLFFLQFSYTNFFVQARH